MIIQKSIGTFNKVRYNPWGKKKDYFSIKITAIMVIDFHCLNFQEDSMHFDLYSAIPLALYKTSK